ncbi:MAG: UbiA family prenyltransferase [Ginsengibacter sp.]
MFGSFFIAACAVAFSIETNVMLGLPFNSFSFYCFIFGATVVQYNLHYLVKTNAVEGSERLVWSLKNKKIHYLLLFFGCALIIYSLFSFQLQHFFILLCLGAISFLYSFPFLPFTKKKRIKDYGFLKIVTLSLLWTLVTVWLPVSQFAYDPALYWFIFVKRFVFMFILCLLFDIRDIEIDHSESINTLAVILEKKKSYVLAYALLILFVLLSIAQYIYIPQGGFLLAMMASSLATYIIIGITKKSNSDFIYLAGIDGMMLLQAILIYLFSFKM